MSNTLHGWISWYNAQGMEADVWLIFQDAAYSGSREAGWAMEGMHELGVGDELTILGADGKTLWSGTIQPISKFFGFKKIYPGDYRWSPPGITPDQWKSWFHQTPPLEATLKKSPGTKRAPQA